MDDGAAGAVDGATEPGATRALSSDDAEAWERLHHEVATADGLDEVWSAEELREEMGTSWAALDRRSRVVVGADGELDAVAWIDARPAAERAWLTLTIRPGRRDALEDRLLRWLLTTARDERATGRLDTANLDTESDAGVAHRIALLERHGFDTVRDFHELRRDLGVPVAEPTVPEGLRIVGWDDARTEACRLAHVEAFQDHWGSSPPDPEAWQMSTTSARNRPDLHRLAVTDDDTVAGYALVGVYPQDWELSGIRDAWVNTLGTRRAWRGRGVASALLLETMRAMQAEGFSHASLGVDSESPTGATRLYATHGFERFRTSVTYRYDLDA